MSQISELKDQLNQTLEENELLMKRHQEFDKMAQEYD